MRRLAKKLITPNLSVRISAGCYAIALLCWLAGPWLATSPATKIRLSIAQNRRVVECSNWLYIYYALFPMHFYWLKDISNVQIHACNNTVVSFHSSSLSVGRSRAVAVIVVQVKNNDSKQERANLVGLAVSTIAFDKVGSSTILNTTMLVVVVLVFIAVLVVAD